MTTIGLFEAKRKLSEVCEQVSKRREPVVITRRGRPIARIEPISPGHGSSSVWSARRDWEKKNGPVREEFNI
jgi:prevent-host-death family protein